MLMVVFSYLQLLSRRLLNVDLGCNQRNPSPLVADTNENLLWKSAEFATGDIWKNRRHSEAFLGGLGSKRDQRCRKCAQLSHDTFRSVDRVGNIGLKLVKVDEARSVAYFIMKSSEAANDLITAFNLSLGDHTMAMRTICPNLSLVTDIEERSVIRQYPMWVAKKSVAKVAVNHKRARE